MFERRLKLLLALFALITMVLILRAGQLQVVQNDQWTQEAAETMKRSQLLDTVRGSIRDRNGKAIAVDTPSVDLCVDYRVLNDPIEPKWLAAKSESRLKARMGEEYTKLSRAERRELISKESEAVKSDITRMWDDLSKMSGKDAAELTDIRQAIIKKVEMRQKLVKMFQYRRAMEKQQQQRESEAFWRRWLVEGIATEKDESEKYAIAIPEQSEAHVILRGVPLDVQNYVGKFRDKYPGLELKASTHRSYPFGEAACHLMGRVSRVNREDLVADDDQPVDETRQYLPNDQIGRGGVESLLEKALRGTKGKVVRVPGKDQEQSRVDPVAGQDAKITIDIELQSRIEKFFPAAPVQDSEGNSAKLVLHGAAVVIDVPTGEVLAMASYPTYDLNSFDDLYAKLYADEINNPLLNRATQAQLQPGSTIKPAVGLSAITSKLISAEQGIECTGYLVIGGRKYGRGRCWVASKFANDPRVPTVAHHQIPPSAPHPTGYLTFGDALERSCNVYFETLADQMGIEGLSQWYERFGLGRITGVGIAEARGRLPRSFDGPQSDRQYKTWVSGIGQDPVTTTPIQMANMAATIARNGVWMRPKLVSADEATRLGVTSPVLTPAVQEMGPDGKRLTAQNWPEAYDLHLDPAALAAARDGMQRVVYGGAGTGKGVARNADALQGIRICGKTGTAQAPKFSIKLRDPETGAVLRDERGRARFEPLEPGTLANPNPVAPWYRGGGDNNRELAHAWYIGFAPAERPQVAFAVMVEYGGSGGIAAAAVARHTLTECVNLGYLNRPGGPVEEPQSAAPAELLRSVATGSRSR